MQLAKLLKKTVVFLSSFAPARCLFLLSFGFTYSASRPIVQAFWRVFSRKIFCPLWRGAFFIGLLARAAFAEFYGKNAHPSSG